MSEQVAIDSLEFARNSGTLRGKIAVADLARLQDARIPAKVRWSTP